MHDGLQQERSTGSVQATWKRVLHIVRDDEEDEQGAPPDRLESLAAAIRDLQQVMRRLSHPLRPFCDYFP